MKAILTVTLVLFGVRVGYTDFIKHCLIEEEYNKMEMSFTNKENTNVKSMNSDRAETAEDYKVANMNELKYDMTLEKEARKMKSCDDYKHGVNYRVGNYGERESNAIWREFMKGSRTDSLHYYIEEEHPLQTSFIQCNLTVTCVVEIPTLSGVHKSSINYIILYGGRGTFSLSDYQRGPPGSKCSHGKTEQGLCIAPPKTELESTTSPKSKIETTAPSRSDSEAIGSSSENNDEGVNSIFVYLSIAFVYLFL
ncbi:hypothetical protein CRE_16348 [Caenorhabditis remanei]|uniref:Uncharacterized protein n=1 Tax=Caenorhabditis remanei TaxID=31234 RepID=E3NC78_CAERE|nr:hypothetical protein CRE_16348 [Caenorhabditis remanei]